MLNIKPLNKNEFPLLLNALTLENWQVEGVHIKCLYKNFSDDFFVAYHNETLVGFILAIKYNDDFGFISNFIVLEKFRSRGFGNKLFNHSLSHLKGCQIALDSMLGKENIYKKAGFETYYDSIFYRFEIGSVKTQASNINIINKIDKKRFLEFNKEIISQKHLLHLNCILKEDKTIFKAVYSEHKLSSFGLCTEYGDGYKVVINAQNNDEALALFFALISEFKLSTKIYMEVMPLDSTLIYITNLLSMKEDSRMSRMYNKVLG